jgi:hypothetical protein
MDQDHPASPSLTHPIGIPQLCHMPALLGRLQNFFESTS